MKNLGLFASIVFLILLVLVLVACPGTNTVLSNLQNVVVASEAAIAVVEAIPGTSINPVVLSNISLYLSQLNSAIVTLQPVLASTTLTAAQKSAQIVAIISKAVAPDLPPGTPQSIIAAVNAVTQAVTTFLSNFVAASSGKMKVVSNSKVTLSQADLATLEKIVVRAQANTNKLKIKK